MTEISDSALIAKVVADDDRTAFEQLVRRHQATLRASMRKLTNGNAELADDVAQEAFVLAWRNIKQFREDAKFSTWLYRIGFNAWQTAIRKKQELPLEDDGVADEHESVESEAEQVGVRRDLERAMRSLTDTERNAILHCYYQDLSHEEAAYVLGLPLGTLKTHVLKAKEKMRVNLLDYANAA